MQACINYLEMSFCILIPIKFRLLISTKLVNTAPSGILNETIASCLVKTWPFLLVGHNVVRPGF